MPSPLQPVLREPSPGSARLTDYASGRSASCTLRSIVGRRLHLSCSVPLPLRASVKVEHENRLWTGDVWACVPDGDSYLLEVEASLVLEDLAGLDRLTARFMHKPDPKASPRSGSPGPLPLTRKSSPAE